MIVAHGAGNDRHYAFAPFFQAALARGFRIVSLDLPGHGRGNTSVFEVERAVEDFAEAVTQAHSLVDAASPWILLGNSLGGSLALRALAEGRLAPAGVIGIGMPTRLHRDGWSVLGECPSLFSRAMRSYRSHVTSWREVYPAFGRFRRDEFPVRCDRDDYLDAVAAVLNRPWDHLEARAPAVLIQGTRDAVARLRETHAWVERMGDRGFPVQLTALRGLGHLDVMLNPRVHAAALDWAERFLRGESVETTLGNPEDSR